MRQGPKIAAQEREIEKRKHNGAIWRDWHRAIFLCLIAGLTGVRSASALDPRTPLDRYARQTWSTENGLPQNSVHALLQTSDGFLWLGTEAGLARFDGYHFTVYDRNSSPALPGDDVRCLLEARMGGLWVGTASGVTLLRDGEARSFTTADGLPTGAIKALVETRDGRLWVLAGGGLAVTSTGKDGAKYFTRVDASGVDSIAGDGGDGLWIATGHGLGHLVRGQIQTAPPTQPADVWASGRIDALARVTEGTGIAIASSAGIFRLKEGHWTTIAARASSEPSASEGVQSMLATKQGVWTAGRNRVTLYEAGHRLVFAAGEALPGTQITSILQDRRGSVWIGTNGGLARYADGRIEKIAGTSDAVLSLFEDRDGELWVGTETEGVRVLRDREFQVIDGSAKTDGASPTSVVQASDGAVWIGTDGSGVLKATSSGRATTPHPNGLTGSTVLALAAGPNGQELWAGTSNGLSLLNNGRSRSFTSADGLADDLVRSLLATRDGSLWIGTPHGLTRLRNGEATTFTVSQGLGSNLVGPMLESANGDLWVGTFGGLSRLRVGSLHNFTVADGLPGNTITALSSGTNGAIWIGTKGQGLARFDGTRFASFAPVRSLPEVIYSVLQDNTGSLWMTSDHGIFRVSIRDLDAWLSDPGSEVPVVTYGSADGLPSTDTAAIGYPSAWRLKDGRLCFVTRRGVVVTDPGADQATAGSPDSSSRRRNEVPPPVAIEEVMVDDRAITIQELASMAPGPLHFSFSFAGIHLSNPQRVEYRYSLDGLDRRWIYAGTRRVAYYTNIPHGRYRFRVSARNELGAWSVPVEVWFELRPHFYQTWWFRVLAAVFVLLIALGAYALRMRALRHRFQLVSAERNRLAREIHDTLAQSFVAVSMRLEIMGQMLKTNDGVERCREQLNQTRALVRDSLEEARRSIWDLRSEGLDGEALPARLARVIQDATATVKGARLETTGVFRLLQRPLEDELYRIAQEAVANALRHAAAGSIRLRLCYELEALRLEVIDDGRGFDPGAVPSHGRGHFGLVGIRERAALIGAAVMLRSVPGEGTTIQVLVPLNRDTKTVNSKTSNAKTGKRQVQ